MTVSASEVRVGKCYVTGFSELRRVVEADISEVKYEPIGSGQAKGAPAPYVSISREKFAAEVDREVECPE